jgi:quinol monooxygenase YgiN
VCFSGNRLDKPWLSGKTTYAFADLEETETKEKTMKTFGLNYDVKPEYVAEFTEYTLKVIDAMQGVSGHVETRLYVDAVRSNSMMIYSNWESVEEFRAFMRSDAFKAAIGETMDMLEGMPSHKVYEQTGDL